VKKPCQKNRTKQTSVPYSIFATALVAESILGVRKTCTFPGSIFFMQM